jgi:hypothetical protein
MDVRFMKAGRKVVKLPSVRDAKRKSKHPKVKKGTYTIPKRKTSTVSPKVGSIPTASGLPTAAPVSSLGSTPMERWAKVGSIPTTQGPLLLQNLPGLNFQHLNHWHSYRHNSFPGFNSQCLSHWQANCCSSLFPGFNPQWLGNWLTNLCSSNNPGFNHQWCNQAGQAKG